MTARTHSRWSFILAFIFFFFLGLLTTESTDAGWEYKGKHVRMKYNSKTGKMIKQKIAPPPKFTPKPVRVAPQLKFTAPKTRTFTPKIKAPTTTIWSPANPLNNPLRYVTPPKPTQNRPAAGGITRPSSAGSTTARQQTTTKKTLPPPPRPTWLTDDQPAKKASPATWTRVSGPVITPIWLDESPGSSSPATVSAGSTYGTASVPEWLNEDEAETPATISDKNRTPVSSGPTWLDDEEAVLPKARMLIAANKSTTKNSGPVWMDEEPSSQPLERQASRENNIKKTNLALDQSKVREKTDKLLQKLDDSFKEAEKPQLAKIDSDFQRRGDKFTDREWRQEADSAEKAELAGDEKKAKDKKRELSREELEKLSCSELLTEMSGATAAHALICQDILDQKQCLRSQDLLSGAPPPSSDAHSSADTSSVADSSSPLVELVNLAMEGKLADEEAAKYYRKLGLKPPEKSWADEIMEGLSTHLKNQHDTREAEVAKVEEIADLMDGYKSPVQTDIPSLQYTSPDGGTPSGLNFDRQNEGDIEAPEVAEDLRDIKGDDETVKHVVGQGQYKYGGTVAAVLNAQQDSATMPIQTWKPGSQPKHGDVKVEDDGTKLIYSENYGDWIGNEVWKQDLAAKVDDPAEKMVWSDDYGDFVSKGIVEMDQKIQQDFEDQKMENSKQRQKDWFDYWVNQDSEPVTTSCEYIAAQDMKAKLINRASDRANNLISPKQLNLLEKRMDRAIKEGAGPEHIKNLYKHYVAYHYYEKGMMGQANAFMEEVEEDYKEIEAKMAIAIACAPYGLAGVGVEVGAYAAAAYFSGKDTGTGALEGVKANLPLNTYNFMKDYLDPNKNVSSWGIIWATSFDYLAIKGLQATASSAKAGQYFGTGWGPTVTDLGDLGKDLMNGLKDKIHKMSFEELSILKKRSSALNNISEFKGLYGEAAGVAARAGKPFSEFGPDLASNPKLKEAFHKIQSDPDALYLLKTSNAADATDSIVSFNRVKGDVGSKTI